MKRAADHQLTRDDVDRDDDDEEEGFRPFQQADEATLATRRILKLPKRRGLGGHSPSPTPSGFGLTENVTTTEVPAPTIAPIATTAFSFGKPSTSGPISGFSFKLPSSTPTAPQSSNLPAPSNPLFSHKPKVSLSKPSNSSPLKEEITASPSGSPNPSSFTQPSVFANPVVSNGLTGSLGKPTSVFPVFPSTISTGTNPTASTAASQDQADFWQGLRGLNESFLRATKNLQERDAFADLSTLFESYCKLRSDLVEKRNKGEKEKTPVSISTSTSAFASAFVGGLSLPKPPTSGGITFGGKPVTFGALNPSANPSIPKTYSFGGKTMSFTSDSGSSVATGGSSQSTVVNEEKGDEKMDEKIDEKPSSQPKFGFGSAAISAAKDKVQTGSTTTGGFTFGPLPGSKPLPPFTPPVTAKPADKPYDPVVAGEGFGIPPPKPGFPSIGTTAATTEEKKPSSIGGFSFGNLPGFSFGKNTSTLPTPSLDSTGNSGFKFLDKPAFNTNSTTTGVVGIGGSTLFPGASAFSIPPTPAGGTPGTETPASTEDAGKDDYVPATEQRYDIEGPGEEDEETIGGKSWRAKIFRLNKQKDEEGKDIGPPSWADYGVAFLRLKKHKETGAKRVLARHMRTGHILINLAFFPQLSPSATDKMVAFIGVYDGAPASYRLRVKSAEEAQDLVKVWKEFIQAK